MFFYLYPRYRKRLWSRHIPAAIFLYWLFFWYDVIGKFRPPPRTFTREEIQALRENIQDKQILFPRVIQTDKYLGINPDQSNLAGVIRDIPDVRSPECRAKTYETMDMPTVSVIIPFHNEIWSVIARTISSVFLRSPQHLLDEIIIVDDASTFDFLFKPLEDFISTIPKVTLLRNPGRQGLIKTRMNGARHARGDVIIFLDSHIEVGYQWLEPLLAALQHNPTAIFSPAIDNIDYDSFRYVPVQESRYSGGFTWNYIYIWKEIPEHINKFRHSIVDPIPSATLIACALAMFRRHFFAMGAFDEDMAIWGGENIEVSLRYWMCAGGVHIIPCSHVGHVYRKYLPYGNPGTGIIEKNYQRSADVWMDDYGKFYYAAQHRRYAYTPAEQASLESRRQLRRRLKCRSFHWFLETVIPEMFVPWENATFQGQMVGMGQKKCIQEDTITGQLTLADCLHDPRQYFYMTNDHRLFTNWTHCATVDGHEELVVMAPCQRPTTTDTQWSVHADIALTMREEATKKGLDVNILVRLQSHWKDGKKCLTQRTVGSPSVQRVGLWGCNEMEMWAHWQFSYEMDMSVLERPPIET